MTLHVFAYFVRVIISESIGMEPAWISKALCRVRILDKNKTESSLVNLITGHNFCSVPNVTEEVSN